MPFHQLTTCAIAAEAIAPSWADIALAQPATADTTLPIISENPALTPSQNWRNCSPLPVTNPTIAAVRVPNHWTT